jgi:hypothetical protein
MKNSEFYSVRYTNAKGHQTFTVVSSLNDIELLIKGEAAKSIIESKVGNSMPLIWHNVLAKHNKELAALSPEKGC